MTNPLRALGLVALIVTLAALPACATTAGAEGSPNQPAATPAAAPAAATDKPVDKPAAMECPMMKMMGQQPGQAGKPGEGMTCPMMEKMKQMHGQGGMMQCPMMSQMMGGHAAQAQLKSDNPVIKAYAEAAARMHKDMGAPLTGDADRDFLTGMIPHHQGAIDMAKIVLQHGKDPKVKKLARQVIAAQEKEIAMMKAWLAQGDGKKPPVKAAPKAAAPSAPATSAPAPGGHSGH